MPEQQTEERQHTVSKHVAEAYLIKHKKLYWGYFFIGKSTMVAHTDFGDYAFHWSAPGLDPKDFLIGCDTEYILRKIAKRDTLDLERSYKRFMEELLQMRRQGELTKERARELYEEMPYDDELVSWAMREQELAEASCYEWATYDYPAADRSMMKALWPLFIEQLKSERAAETAPQEATA